MTLRAADPLSTSTAPAFDRWLDAFFASHFRRNPVNATFTGIHDHDHVLPDASRGAVAANEAEMTQLRAELAALPDEPLTEAQRHDRALADGALELALWENHSAHFHLGNPSWSTGEAVFSVMALFQRDAEPVGDRAAAAEARMRAMPAFLAQGRANVTSAPAEWTERAIREARSGVAYFGRGFGLLMDERGIRSDGLTAAAANAAARLPRAPRLAGGDAAVGDERGLRGGTGGVRALPARRASARAGARRRLGRPVRP